jgi:Zn-finger nucleic acid-binding protein
VLCPKDCKTPLTQGLLTQSLVVQCCEDCKGTWIPSQEYEAWQAQQPTTNPDPKKLKQPLDVDYVQSPYDTKAALCPECKNYLARARISLEKPFYVERCPNCGGIWCDRGEWDILEKLGFHYTIQALFTQEWQARVRKRELIEQERQAMMDKLGQELAQKVFELAEALEKHPHGDFAVAYLMRRFEDT